MNERERFENIDFIKMVMMVLVCLYHSAAIYSGIGWGPQDPVRESKLIGHVASYVGTIHIYTFAAMSGYIFYYLWYEAKVYRDAMHVIRGKVKRLIIPYISACAVWVVPFNAVYIEHEVNIGSIVKKIRSGGAPSQLWFLLMLFWVFVIFAVLCTKIDFSKTSSSLVFFLLLCAHYGGYVLGYIGMPNAWQIITAIKYLLFFYLGMWLRKNAFAVKRGSFRKYGMIALCVSIAIFELKRYLWSAVFPADSMLMKVIAMLISPVMYAAGVLAAYFLLSLLAERVDLAGRCVKSLMQGSMVIYLFHQQLIYVSICIFNVQSVPPMGLVLLNFGISFAGSYMIYLLLRRFRWTRALFGM